MQDCIFCKIIAGEIPSEFIHESEHFVVIKDIQPAAKEHFLLLPKKHVSDILDLAKDLDCKEIISELPEVISAVAKKTGLDESGFRLVSNCGTSAGQTVFHLHFHLLGGQQLGTMC